MASKQARIVCYARDGAWEWNPDIHIDAGRLLEVWLSALPVFDDAVTIYKAED